MILLPKTSVENVRVFDKSFWLLGSELIVNRKDFPNAVEGDIVEVYHSDSEHNKLLLQILAFKDDLQSKGE